MTLGNFGVIICYTVIAIKNKKKIEPNCHLKIIWNKALFFSGILTTNIEINVLLNWRPICFFYQPIAGLVFMDSAIQFERILTIFISLLSVCWHKG